MSASYLRPKRGKRSTAENQQLVLMRGEIFMECPDAGVGRGAGRIKVGDGATKYADLPYFMNPDDFIINISDSTVTFTPTTDADNNVILGRIIPGKELKKIVAATKNLLSNLNTSVNSLNNDITDMRTNFQAGVDSVYDAVDAKGSTPASKALSDIIAAIDAIETGITPTGTININSNNTYNVTNYASAIVNVPNSNSGTYEVTSKSTFDMGATNNKRYIDARNVANVNSGTYSPTSKGTFDMGIDNDKRYVDTRNVANSNSSTYSPTSKGTFDMGETNDRRYIDTRSVANTNSGTFDVTSNGIKDMTATNDKRYVNVAVPNSNSGTYTPTTKSTFDMGATNDKRYVDTRSVANVNSGTFDVTSNGIKDMTATNDKRYVNVAVPNTNSGTYTFPVDSIGNTTDLGETNSYRYVNATAVYNKGKSEGTTEHTETYEINSNGTTDLTDHHNYRYIDVQVPNSNSGTYTPTTKSTFDMGATNNKRYIDTRSVANINDGTYTFPADSSGDTTDLGENNSYRYVNAIAVYNKGKSEGTTEHTETYEINSNGTTDLTAHHIYRYIDVSVANSNSGTYTPTSKGTFDMGATNDKRYIDTRSIPNTNSGTFDVTSNGIKDMTATNDKRYVNVAVPNTNTGTYTPTSKSTFDMGETNDKRYIDTRSVANVNSGTFEFPERSDGAGIDLEENNTYRFVVATSVYNNGITYADGRLNTSSTSYITGYSNGTNDGYSSGYNAGSSAGYSSGYDSGVYDADHRVNTDSASYVSGYSNGNSAGYSSGYSAGTAAGYSSGYNQGVYDADNRVNTSSASYTAGYNQGKSNAIAVNLVGTAQNGSRLVSSWTFAATVGKYYAISLGAGYSGTGWTTISASVEGADLISQGQNGRDYNGFGYCYGAVVKATSTSVKFNIVTNTECCYGMVAIEIGG